MSLLKKILLGAGITVGVIAAGYLTVACNPTVLDVGVYSDGYRVGVLNSWKSPIYNFLTPTTEGDLHLGGSGRPFPFSSDMAMKEKYLAKYAGQTVVLHYHQVQFQLSTLSGLTAYRVVDIEPVDRQHIPAACGTEHVTKSMQMQTGHIIMVAHKGNVIKSDELRMQLGSGVDKDDNGFKISIDNKEMLNCALAFERSDHAVNIFYTEHYVGDYVLHDTNLTVEAIVPVDDKP